MPAPPFVKKGAEEEKTASKGAPSFSKSRKRKAGKSAPIQKSMRGGRGFRGGQR